MKIEVGDESQSYFTANLRVSPTGDLRNLISFDHDNTSTHFLFVRRLENRPADLRDDTVRRQLENLSPQTGEEQTCSKTLSAFLRERRGFRGYADSQTGSAYPAWLSVFPCVLQGDVLHVYAASEPEDNAVKIPTTVYYSLQKHGDGMGRGLLARLRRPGADRYVLKVAEAGAYRDGTLFYQVEGSPFRYFISAAMLGREMRVEVPTGARLEFKTTNPDVHIHKI